MKSIDSKRLTHPLPVFLVMFGLLLATLVPLTAFAQDTTATETAAGTKSKHRIPLLAAGLNFFIPGAGYLYNGEKPVYVSLPLIAGAGGLTYLEQFHQYGDSGQTLREYDETAFLVMFGSVFVVNTALAIDAFREARQLNLREGTAKTALRFGVSPMGNPDGRLGYGLTLNGDW